MDHIILTGFMGCGKTSLGIRLSYRLKIPFVDTDRRIEKEQGCTIAELFENEGEPFFRQLETECLIKLLEEKNCYVISAGGGLPMRKENRRLLKKLGYTVYLTASPDTIYERLKDDTSRPLLAGSDPRARIGELMKERHGRYLSAADAVIPVDGREFEEIADEFLENYTKRRPNRQQRRRRAEGR